MSKMDMPQKRKTAGLPGVDRRPPTRTVPPRVRRNKSPLVRWLRGIGTTPHAPTTIDWDQWRADQIDQEWDDAEKEYYDQ